MGAARKLTNLQLELLETFSFELTEEQLLEIRQMLIDYFADKVTSGMDQLFEQNHWGEEKIEEWAEEHMRIPYEDSAN